MISPARILDRGRLLVGVMVVAPLGVLIPAAAPPATSGQSAPAPEAVSQNPLAAPPPTAAEVVANLTALTAPVSAQTAAPAASRPVAQASAEVGSESADDGTPPAVQAIEGTAPDATLAARLRRSQSRFAPVTPAVPQGTGLPYATPPLAAIGVPGRASHVFPVVGGASYSNDWGAARATTGSHKGIDLFARRGTPLVAVADGTLFRVGWNRVGGWRLWVRDRWGNEFYYAHLQSYAPAAVEGAQVKAGTVVGFVGDTGDAKGTPPHLHFEIHPGGGEAIPPFSYVNVWPRV